MQTRRNILPGAALVDDLSDLTGVGARREPTGLDAGEPDYAALLALRGSGGVAEGYDPKAQGAAAPRNSNGN